MGATAGSATLTTGGVTFFEDTSGATSVRVSIDSGSANPALIRVDGLHASGDTFPMIAGDEQVFRLNHCGIKKIWGQGNGGNATITYGVVSKTNSEG